MNLLSIALPLPQFFESKALTNSITQNIIYASWLKLLCVFNIQNNIIINKTSPFKKKKKIQGISCYKGKKCFEYLTN